MAKPYVQLMGRSGVQTGTGWVDLLPERRHQLLAYLAYANGWVARDQLAYLFWPGTTTQTARGNLRSLLERVRDFPWLTDLETERNRVRWSVTSDVATLEAALSRAERAPDEATEVAALFSGQLLDGIGGYDDNEFANWLELERGNLYSRWRTCLLRQVELAVGRRDIDRALGLLERLLVVDRLDEEAVQRFLTVANERPWRDRALNVYREFSRHLDRELGLEPAETTQHLARRLEEVSDEQGGGAAGQDAAPVAAAGEAVAGAPGVGTQLPAPGSSFVGRVEERAEIARQLARPECRLLTLVGPGGMGKTRLALRVAHDLRSHYAGGTFFVRLESVATPAAIPARIAEALDLPALHGDDPLAQVAAYLGDRKVLLVLDNLEHLLAGAGAVSLLLARCPNLSVIATSRERLNLSEEWTLPVGGLPFPEGALGSQAALGFDAVQLFVQRARRYAPRWSLADADAPAVARICQMLDGNPLALELAAVWLRVMAAADLVRELESSLDFLSSAARDSIERHASIRATFEHSWRLLTEVEQDGLRNLAVFRGGVTREAAAAVAGVATPVLAALVDKSLLRVGSDGRYDRHQLLEQFAREKLAADPEQATRLAERHAEYFLRLLIEWGARLEGPRGARALAVLEADLGNVLAAWRWAISNVRLRELQETTTPLQRFFALQDRGREGAEVFGQLVAALSEADPEHRAALGYALLSRGYFLPRGHPERKRVVESGLNLLRPLQEGTGVLWGLYVLGLSAASTGERDALRQYLEEAAALAVEQGDERARGDCLTNLARLAQDGGDYDDAIAYAREAVAVWQALHDGHGEAWARTWWGLAALRSGRLDDAAQAMERALALARERGDALQTSLLTAHTGLLEHVRGDHARARDLHLEALAIEIGRAEDAFTRPMYLADLARVEIALGNHQEAESLVRASLELSEPHGWVAHEVSAMAAMATLEVARGRLEAGLELAFLVLRHDASEHVHHEQMQALIGSVREALPEETLDAARRRAASLRLEEVARKLVPGRGLRAAAQRDAAP